MWYDPWVSGIAGKVPKLKQGARRGEIRLVAELKGREDGLWNEELIHSLFNEEKAKSILTIHGPSNLGEDKLMWLDKNSGSFSVKGSYLLNYNNSEDEVSMTWKNLWNLKIHDRMKLFLW